jgi:hypothetical protein
MSSLGHLSDADIAALLAKENLTEQDLVEQAPKMLQRSLFDKAWHLFFHTIITVCYLFIFVASVMAVVGAIIFFFFHLSTLLALVVAVGGVAILAFALFALVVCLNLKR